MKKFQFIILVFLWLLALHSKAQNNQSQWESEFKVFDQLDGDSPKQGGILFTGSSSIRFWENPAKDFKNHNIVKRGFGGSEIIDLIENFDRVILRYHPQKIVIYSGDNDVQNGKSAEVVYGDFCTLFGMIKVKLPNAEVYFIAIKPSLNRWNKVFEMIKANTMINEFLNTKSNAYFIDVFSPMICDDGKPCEKWFVKDGLHLSKKGYRLWTKIIKPYLKE